MTNFKALIFKRVVAPVLLVALFTASPACSGAIHHLCDFIGRHGGRWQGLHVEGGNLSANLDSNVAIGGFDMQGNAQYVATQCVPGSGDDIIVLPTATNPVVLVLDTYANDLNNVAGPSVLPAITSNIIIEGNGATLQGSNCNGKFNGFGNPCPYPSNNDRLVTVTSTGNLTLLDLTVMGFATRGGDAGGTATRGGSEGGGGGGLGAGGAIYVRGGRLTVQNCTFEGNSAVGGDGTSLKTQPLRRRRRRRRDIRQRRGGRLLPPELRRLRRRRWRCLHGRDIRDNQGDGGAGGGLVLFANYKACAAAQAARPAETRQPGRLGKTPPATAEEVEEEVGDSSAAVMGAAANMAVAAVAARLKAEMAATADLGAAAAQERQVHSVARGAAAEDLAAGAARLRTEQ